ncbi:GNAT family N-acetyltransferase [Methylobrevis albus]
MKSSDLPIETTGAASLAMLAAVPSAVSACVFRREAPADAAAIEAIHEATFGPGRFARTAFRLREGVASVAALSLVAERQGQVVGSVRLTPILIGETAPALLLGPLAVLPELKSQGIGKALMRRSIDLARQDGHRLIVLVGDLPYYWPFGFRTVPPGKLGFPGPVDPARLLAAELVPGTLASVGGMVRADRTPAA